VTLCNSLFVFYSSILMSGNRSCSLRSPLSYSSHCFQTSSLVWLNRHHVGLRYSLLIQTSFIKRDHVLPWTCLMPDICFVMELWKKIPLSVSICNLCLRARVYFRHDNLKLPNFHHVTYIAVARSSSAFWYERVIYLRFCGWSHVFVRYDTIRDAILTCAQKPTRVSLIPHGTNN